jgi:polysaccharide deacetylase 2 family uncharacterized protein YibQ
MADELTRPLGLDPPPPKGRRLVAIAIAAPLLAGIAGTGFLWLGRDPGTGEPAVTAPIAGIAGRAATGSIAAKPGKAHAANPMPVDPSTPALTEAAADGGVAPPGQAPAEVVIQDASKPGAIRLAAAPRQDLVEQSRYGLLPRIGEDGTRPMQAYARPVEVAAGMKRVAIVIGGIGIAAAGTTAALGDLPGEVTLAFAPYGDALPRTVASARAAGHEILLQVPLEPYGYPQVDPGPHTLTTKASAAENLDNLHWLLGRLTSYVGAVNYMGARFSSEPAAMTPLLNELGKRGLLYLDDGSSPRSARTPVPPGAAPVLRADIVLDADTTPSAIDARLDELAAIARERGSAIATGSAFPTTVDRVAAFARAAADRGIVLVPITALLPSGKS